MDCTPRKYGFKDYNEKHYFPKRIIAILQSRKGFDAWWDEVFNDNREEILDEMEKIFNELRDAI